MDKYWTVYQHRHTNGAMFPVQPRIIAENKKQLDASLADGSEELQCVQCGAATISSKLSSDFVPISNLARRYPHYEEGMVTRVISKTNEIWFGFVKTNDGREIYFPGLHGRKFIRRAGKFPIMATWTQQKNMRKIEMPAFGTRILFETKVHENEIKVHCWGYADEYDSIVSELKEDINSNSSLLPLTYNQQKYLNPSSFVQATYRIMEQTFYNDNDSFAKPVQIWIGSDLSEINRTCPLSHLVPVEIGGYKKITWFERWKNEQWIDCDDPRYASGALHLSPPL